MVNIIMPRPVKIKCPWCGNTNKYASYYFADGDLIQCKKCGGKIDVVKKGKGNAKYLKSTDTYGD